MMWNQDKIRKLAMTTVFFAIAIIFVSVTIAFLIITLKSTGGDILAFTGSVIGGAITWFGVRATLKQGQMDKFLESFQQQIKVLHPAVEDLKFIMSIEIYMMMTIVEDSDLTLKYKIELIQEFKQKLDKNIPELIGHVSWGVMHKIDIYSTKFGILPYVAAAVNTASESLKIDPSDNIEMNRFNVRRNDTNKMLENAREIYNVLNEHKESIIKKYYGIK